MEVTPHDREQEVEDRLDEILYPVIEGGVKYVDLPAAKWGPDNKKEVSSMLLYPSFSIIESDEVCRSFIEEGSGDLAAEVWRDGAWVPFDAISASEGRTIGRYKAAELVGGPVWPRGGSK